MAKSDARFEFKANLNRTDFDLSQRNGFTSAAGMLLPIWCDIASPGDSYYMQHDLPLLRSAVLAAPAMVDVKVHFETFFVPMQMIYQPFENTIFSLKNLQSSYYDRASLQNNDFPLLDYPTFISNILTNYAEEDYRADAFRLADLFGLSPINFCRAPLGNQDTDAAVLNNLMQYKPMFFPWQILTYHTIFEYYYRLDDKTQFSVLYCNWDRYYNNRAISDVPDDFMKIHQRPWDFDYFTSMYRSAIISDDNMQSVHLPSSTLVSVATQEINTNGSATDLSNLDIKAFSSQANQVYSNINIKQAISTAAIRQMFANEKLAMITGRTRKNYDSQVLAHYGVNVPHDVKHELTMIHHDEYDLNVQEVTSLASSDSTPLGELAGKSYAVGNGKQFKFTAPCHGVVMTIFSVEPKKRYFGGFDKINAITNAYDLPTPEFDRLGNVPMYRYETGMKPQSSAFTMSDIIGWKERYYQYKRKYDRTSFAFGNALTSDNVNNYSPYMLSFRPFGLFNSGVSNVTQAPRPDDGNRFYIERSAMDALCLVYYHYGWIDSTTKGAEDWSTSPWLVYARDPFIVNSNIKCKKISWMSKDGEPIYNF